MMAAAPSSKCPAPAPPRRPRPSPSLVIVMRWCRCCEDTRGTRRRRAYAFPELHQLQPLLRQQPPHAGAPPPPPRPRRIVLVRHGESEGNVDEAVYTRVPDPQIGLTAKGWRDAEDCGRRLRDLFSSSATDDDWKVFFYVSPYRRTLESLRGMGRAFEPHRVAGVREEPRLREQDFGNLQDREQMRASKDARLRYGRFFYRFPNGESAADVYDRITGFRDTLLGDIDIGRFQPPDGPATRDMNIVLVSHGLTLRVFLMRWYRWTVRQFEGLGNLPNGGAIVMQTGEGGRYSLLVHHTADELREFGLTDEMLRDQMWQGTARPGELNYAYMTKTNGRQCFFDDPFTPPPSP